MSPDPTLPPILRKLQAARPVWKFDKLLAHVLTLNSPAAGQGLKALAPEVHTRMTDAPKAGKRFIFKESDAFDPAFGEYPRIDLVVKDLLTSPPSEHDIEAALDGIPTLTSVLHLRNEVPGSVFTCPAEVRSRLHAVAPDLTLAGLNAAPGLATFVKVATEQATNLIVEWWRVRFDCLTLAVSELLNALRSDTIKAVAVGPDGSRKRIPASYWKSSDSWSIIFDGLSYVEREHYFTPGERLAEAGVYIEAADPVPLIRKGRVTSSTEVEARLWLIEQIKASPNKAPKTSTQYKMEIKQRWGVSGNGTDRVWDYAVNNAGEHNWKKGGAPKKSET